MKTRLILLATVAAALAACSSVPARNGELESARGRVAAASSDPQVAALAPDELKRANDSLRMADQAWTAGDKSYRVDHLAYMANQRAVIAQETATSKAAQAVTAGAAAERDKLRLAVRTNEVDMAQQKLAVAQQANVQKTAELAAADAAAQRDQARVARRDARVSDLEMQLQALNAKKTDKGMVVTLGDVLFDSGKSQLLPTSSGNMSKLADFFKRNPQRSASIEGYTDSMGGEAANQALSERRAGAVKMALVSLGVSSDRLSTQAHGEAMPVASNDTASGRQMNRRVEIVFAQTADDMAVK
nr:OmpA family protein [uncultured Roseateles sp.]